MQQVKVQKQLLMAKGDSSSEKPSNPFDEDILITTDLRAKAMVSFSKLNPVDGKLSGQQVKYI